MDLLIINMINSSGIIERIGQERITSSSQSHTAHSLRKAARGSFEPHYEMNEHRVWWECTAQTRHLQSATLNELEPWGHVGTEPRRSSPWTT